MCEHFQQVLTSKQTTRQIHKRQLDEEKNASTSMFFDVLFFHLSSQLFLSRKVRSYNYVNKMRSKSVRNLTKYTVNSHSYAREFPFWWFDWCGFVSHFSTCVTQSVAAFSVNLEGGKKHLSHCLRILCCIYLHRN